ncbi:eukaryotic translation initiation factor 2A [Diabrotica virgifera virgifera]|uniref:Eukaryotic translation initiation factor 2A n=1 Tax=Diabrotica virgifera virgifera TaxID=50390 RepID=A0ABM5L4Q5_DIAVI|nr:eukaryotic translation initiation factor 2A [Diabrotica virgifera virgifera]
MAIPIAARSSSGITLYEGLPTPGNKPTCPPIQSKACRTMLFDQDGKYLAYVNGQTLCVLQTENWQTLATIENVKAYQLAFSPKGTFLMSWEPFTVSNANPQGTPNLKIYKTANGELVKTFVHKKQANWEPQWSHDEKLFSRIVNTDVVFYEDLNFERIVARINSSKVSSYKISPNVGVYFVLCHTLGSPGQPSLARLFKYPSFDTTQAIANRSFFQADKVDIMWNAKGNSALLLTSTEVDKTGGSYYGKQGLYFVGLNGETSIITLSKEGPIYSVEWSPKNNEFCVIYGFMPAKATIFNIKCEPVFELGSGPKNAIHYNPQGNILLLGGFGNLRGQVELWDTANWKKISSCEAPDTTLLHWAADGEHFLTATTAPRLRISNGYKIWHYTGVLIFEHPHKEPEELYDVAWKNVPKGVFRDPVISAKKVEGIAPSQPQASAQVYRPPSARNRPTVNFNLHEDEETAHKPGKDSAPSKASLKQKKKREAKKAKKLEEVNEDEPKTPAAVSSVKINLTGDPELDKKLKNIKKKLDAIEKLKTQQAEGKTLEINQLEKIKAENDLLAELKNLTV